MICSKYDKSIEIGKEIQIEGSIICKSCKDDSKEIIARCHTCREPIYKNDLVYEITPSWGIEHIVSINHSERKIQCDWCFKRWSDEQKEQEKKKWWKNRRWILFLSSSLLLSIILFSLYPALKNSWTTLSGQSNCRLWLPWVVCIFLLLSSLAIIYLLYWIISKEFASRYKPRNRNRNNKPKTNKKSKK